MPYVNKELLKKKQKSLSLQQFLDYNRDDSQSNNDFFSENDIFIEFDINGSVIFSQRTIYSPYTNKYLYVNNYSNLCNINYFFCIRFDKYYLLLLYSKSKQYWFVCYFNNMEFNKSIISEYEDEIVDKIINLYNKGIEFENINFILSALKLKKFIEPYLFLESL